MLRARNRGGHEAGGLAVCPTSGLRMPPAALWAGYYPRRLGRCELMRDRLERGGCNVKNVDPPRKIDA